MVDVPGYGRFDPELPSWLRLEPDGKLYNVNALSNKAADGSFQAVRPWVPPAGYVGGSGLVFTPEAAVPPVPPAPEPPVPPAPEPPADPYVAYVEYQREAFAAAKAEADARFDAALDNAARVYDAENAALTRVLAALDKFEAALAARR